MTIAYTAGANDSVLDQTTQFDQFHYAYYSGTWKRLPNFSQLTPVHTGYSSAINLDDRPKDSYFGAVFVGQLKIDIAGDYTFYITSDDGSKLIIDGRPMIDNDDTHASKTEQGTVFLSAGYHQIRVEFFQRKGGKKLAVYYQGADTNNNKQTLDSPTLALKASPPQFHYAYYSGKWKRLPNFSKLIPVDTGYSATINLDDRPKGSYFGAVFVSQLKIETAGDYRFYATSDDGSKLIIDGQPVVDNDGTHASKTKSGTQYLSTGYHQIRVEFFQRKDGKKLEIHYQGADTDQRKQTLRPSTICFCADASQIEYQYDELSRLTSVLVPESDLKISYVYDAMGNRLAQHSGTITDQTLKNHSFSVVQPTDLPASSFDDLTLSWVHQVPEGGHFYYEVYFGDTNSPDLYKSGLTEQSLHIGAVESSLRQFLQIKAIDSRGNEATSPIWILSPLDTDSDGIPDHIENTICVDAQNADSDNDGLSDGLEDQPIFGIITPQETDPCNPDSDGDRMPDGWEVQNGLNPLDAEDANSDTDEDGLSHLQEF
ncbi:PA14 domain-containing protein, partial [uncultured Oceanicoccus sp.]|uniref:PA14 domain-containing protein n=1 Tax=uncultured Oceanicoccus sp. TaxID=1706381 RepID=UPI0030D875A4